MKKIRKFTKKELEKSEIPKDVQFVASKKCQLITKGGYCNVPLGRTLELIEHNIGDVLNIVDILSVLRLEVKILGGNLSDNRQAFMAIVDRMNKRDVNYAITDNAINRETILETINRYGVKGFVFSLDTLKSLPQFKNLSTVDLGGCSAMKSNAALELVPEIRRKVPYVAVNTIIHAGNLKQIIPIVEYCTDELDGVIVNG